MTNSMWVRRNPFADAELVDGYEAWYSNAGIMADQQEKALLQRLLADFPEAQTILDVGCGTGHFTRWYEIKRLRATGIDLSRPMLAEALRLGTPVCAAGDAQELPFADGSFDLVSLITTLEFLPDPERALAEAARVARYGLIIGALNRQSLMGWRLMRSNAEPWRSARFFAPTRLADMAQRAVGGQAEVTWRTTILPARAGDSTHPWGGFIGMEVRLQGE